MGKQGPCYHCGVTSTPLWRNGPPEKPVLCNACGSRWRTKGTLVNYTPLHSRADPDDFDDQRVSRVKTISLKKHKEIKLLKRKANYDSMITGDYNQGFRKVVDEDASNRSSSGSAISNSESCAQFGSGEASDLTDPAQSVVWDTLVPSKKRTCFNRPQPSSVEKLTKDLCTILHEQSSYLSGSSEEDLLFDSEMPMVSVEIGHGSVLIRHPSSIARDEESEASSLSVENRQYSANDLYSRSPLHNVSNTASCLNIKSKHPIGQGMQPQPQRDKSQHEKVQIFGGRGSPLCNIDLHDILNFEEFTTTLTNEEHQQLFKYLPQLDTSTRPESLKNMFDCPQFSESLCSFQQLLLDGVFDNSLAGVETEGCKTLKRLALSNLTKSKWVEYYYHLKNLKKSNGKCVDNGIRRSQDSQSQNIPPEVKGKKQAADSNGSCFSERRLFAVPPESSSLMMESFHLVDNDHNLLLDMPSSTSFPQAELLHPH